ncbi:DUF1360 domain-containing protein [Mycobacteroides chelonae]|uniref:DUF1360 domain-containing protein n=1 Tax=Mycobacteroides chelonae TaxID=1774 RepID=UPI0008A9CA59|nr:DUF1360 domain-containing protein [Mycobacteroides chelonae]OHU29032.1 hypothetical protein BKG78_23455 [Mycobacteroides chelonae]
MNLGLGHAILILVIYVLAVMRLVRLINYDTVLDPLRLWIARRASTAQTASKEAFLAEQPVIAQAHARRMGRWNVLAYFLGCPWCVGFWLSLATGVLPVRIIGWPWWAFAPVALACSYLVGLVAPVSADEMEIVSDEDEGDE